MGDVTPRPSGSAPATAASRPAPSRAVLSEVAELLAGPGLAWAVQRVRGQLETGADPVAVLQLPTATPAQRAGARSVLGPAAAVRGTHLAVRVSDLDELLLELTGWDRGLAAAVRALDEGLPGAEAEEEEDDDDAVALPATAAAAVAGPPATEPEPERVELGALEAEQVGLALADAALVLDLPADPGGATGTVLTALSAVGLPALLTLHQLRDAPPTWLPAPPGGTVLVVPTPAVLAAVAGTPAPGARRPRVPVVCLDATATARGVDPAWPGDAVVVVLEGLRAAGWQLLLNGGDGPEGDVITELLAGELGARVWRSPAEPGTPLREQLLADARRLAR